jgi:hypothetical protein
MQTKRGMYTQQTNPGKRSANNGPKVASYTAVTHGRGYGPWALCCTYVATGRRLAVQVAYHGPQGQLVAVRAATQAGVTVLLQASQVANLSLGNTTPGPGFGQGKGY